ncbi:MAG: NUDIX hydrolase [Phycisphaeraceae bacterium]
MSKGYIARTERASRRSFKATVSTAVMDRHHLLLVRQGIGTNRSRWNLPGGKVRAGESLVYAAVRETREETGYDVRVTSVAGLYSYDSRSGGHRMRFVFFGQIEGGQSDCDGREIIDVRWFTLRQVAAMDDGNLCRPAMLRRIFDDLRNPVRAPLRMLCDLAAQLVAA